MSEIIILSGSPSENSGSDKVLLYLGSLLEKEGLSVTHLSVKDVPYQDLFEGRYNSPSVVGITRLIQNSKGVLVGSPVYKSSYTGVLKALIDLLPPDVFEHKPVLPLMSGGSSSHLLALEYSLKPLLASLKAHNLKGIYLINEQIDKRKDTPIIDEELLQRAEKQLNYFIHLVNRQKQATPVFLQQ